MLLNQSKGKSNVYSPPPSPASSLARSSARSRLPLPYASRWQLGTAALLSQRCGQQCPSTSRNVMSHQYCTRQHELAERTLMECTDPIPRVDQARRDGGSCHVRIKETYASFVFAIRSDALSSDTDMRSKRSGSAALPTNDHRYAQYALHSWYGFDLFGQFTSPSDCGGWRWWWESGGRRKHHSSLQYFKNISSKYYIYMYDFSSTPKRPFYCKSYVRVRKQHTYIVAECSCATPRSTECARKECDFLISIFSFFLEDGSGCLYS